MTLPGGGIGAWLRKNVLGLLALYVALGGTALALTANSVKSKHIKDGTVRAEDVNSGQVQLRVGAGCGAGAAISAIAEDGTVTCEADSAGGQPSGAAGGSLTGQYPNPSIAAGAVASAEVADETLTADDIDEPSLFNDDSLDALDIDEAGLDTTILQARVGTGCATGAAIRTIAQNGAVSCEADDAGGPPSGAAGGDLTGSYPNPSIASGAVTSSKVLDNSLTGNDLDEATLAGVGNSSVATAAPPGGIALSGTPATVVTTSAGAGPVAVAANERLLASASLFVFSELSAGSSAYAVCSLYAEPAGGGTSVELGTPGRVELGGSLGTRSDQLPVLGSASIPAGSYQVSASCTGPASGLTFGDGSLLAWTVGT